MFNERIDAGADLRSGPDMNCNVTRVTHCRKLRVTGRCALYSCMDRQLYMRP